MRGLTVANPLLPMSRRRTGGSHGQRGRGPLCEWVGGRFSTPIFIAEEGREPFRAKIVFWVEVPSGLVVGNQVLAPGDAEGAVARVLAAALEHPIAGPRRLPHRIRVADEALAAEVQSVVGLRVPVTVAPTPELDVVIEAMLDDLPRQEADDASYLEHGIPPARIGALFAAAEMLHRMGPWKAAADDRVVRMDIPALGVEAACVSIIGNLGATRGFLVFPSLAGYEAFLDGADRPLPARGAVDLGTDFIALSFERAVDLPARMRREVMDHGWSVAGADAYPRVERRESDGLVRPLVARDVEIATACAASLGVFVLKHQSWFAGVDGEPVCESYHDQNDREVRFTIPYEAYRLFDVETATPGDAELPGAPSASGWRRVGRNDPSPCGSGKKYKKCHLPLASRAAGDRSRRVPAAGAGDRVAVGRACGGRPPRSELRPRCRPRSRLQAAARARQVRRSPLSR